MGENTCPAAGRWDWPAIAGPCSTGRRRPMARTCRTLCRGAGCRVPAAAGPPGQCRDRAPHAAPPDPGRCDLELPRGVSAQAPSGAAPVTGAWAPRVRLPVDRARALHSAQAARALGLLTRGPQTLRPSMNARGPGVRLASVPHEPLPSGRHGSRCLPAACPGRVRPCGAGAVVCCRIRFSEGLGLRRPLAPPEALADRVTGRAPRARAGPGLHLACGLGYPLSLGGARCTAPGRLTPRRGPVRGAPRRLPPPASAHQRQGRSSACAPRCHRASPVDGVVELRGLPLWAAGPPPGTDGTPWPPWSACWATTAAGWRPVDGTRGAPGVANSCS